LVGAAVRVRSVLGLQSSACARRACARLAGTPEPDSDPRASRIGRNLVAEAGRDGVVAVLEAKSLVDLDRLAAAQRGLICHVDHPMRMRY